MGGKGKALIPWPERCPDDFSQFQKELAKEFPDLTLLCNGSSVQLQGSIPIIQNGVELDRFQIRVAVPPEFPDMIPMVWELGGRVPPTANWHTLAKGALCIIVPEEWLIKPESKSLLAFLKGPVRNYLIGHSFAEMGMARPMGERPHCEPGLLEAYGEMLACEDPKLTVELLKYLALVRIKGHWICACGSGRQLRKCHMPQVLGLQATITPRIAKMALKRLHGQTNGKIGVVMKPS